VPRTPPKNLRFGQFGNEVDYIGYYFNIKLTDINLGCFSIHIHCLILLGPCNISTFFIRKLRQTEFMNSERDFGQVLLALMS
jgi:hypothetical protein